MNLTREETAIMYKEAHEKFEYRNGCLFLKISFGKRWKIGSKAGTLHHSGRIVTAFSGKGQFQISRIIFLMHHGYLPIQVDHIDRNPLNNNIENLRGASISENQFNVAKKSRKDKVPSSKYKGVIKTQYNTFRARIGIGYKRYNLGHFKSEIEAALAYNEKAKELHGEFATLNII